jgi:hypothetical protein
MTRLMKQAGRTARLHRGRVVYAAMPAPAWVPEPIEPPTRRVRVLARTRARRPSRFQPVGEAALGAMSDGSAVLSIVRR